MIVDLDASQPVVATAGRGLYALLLNLDLQGTIKSSALGGPGVDLFAHIEERDELVLAWAAHAGNPTLVLEAVMTMSMLTRKGGQVAIDCISSPDLGLAVALCKHFDMIMAVPVPNPAIPGATMTFLGSLLWHFQFCLAGQPYALGKVLANNLLLKVITALVDHSTTQPVATVGLVNTIIIELDGQPKLRRKHQAKIDEAVSIALAGLPNTGPTIAVRERWMALGGRQHVQRAPTPSIGAFVSRLRLVDECRRS